MLPAVTGELITKVAIGSSVDVDKAVIAARKAFKTAWGLNIPGSVRGELLYKVAGLLETHINELAALDALDNGYFQEIMPHQRLTDIT
jgi:aldehyde dehydrogenase (NAD+)